MKPGNIFCFFTCALALLCIAGVSVSQDATTLRFGSLIEKNNIQNHLNVLASDSLEGRETGRAGQKKAAAFIADHFSSLGLAPISHGKYFQHHPITVRSNRGKNIEVHQKNFLFMKDYFFLPGFNDTLIVLDSILFVGYGISEERYDDYNGLSVEGKAVLFFDGHPRERKINVSSWSHDKKKKQDIIYKKKPSVVFMIVDSIDKIIDSLIYGVQTHDLQTGLQGPSIPTVFITHEMAKTFFPEIDNEDLDKAKSFIDRKNKPRSFPVSTAAFVHLMANTDVLMGENVAGYLEGTDKKDEVVIITAHYDHLGVRDSLIYYGADDNGSGTSALMEMARVFAIAKKEGHGPRRSILFMAVSGEEKGLRGSAYYVSHPLLPLEKTVVNLNCDMIGRTDRKHDSLGVRDYVYIIGADKISTRLHLINEAANSDYTKLKLDYQFNNESDPNRYYSRSDHYNFVKHNIPIIFYFNGTHADYHKPSDTIEKIDFDLLTKRAQLIFFTAWELVNRDERIYPDVKKGVERE